MAAVVLLFATSVVAQQPEPTQKPATQKPAMQKPAAKPAAGTATPSPEFEKLLKAATEARQAERWQEAIGLYEKIVKLKPDYVEGYWYQGTA